MAGIMESIVERLQRVKGHWGTVARLADVPYQSLAIVARNERAPRIDTLEKIDAGLKEFEKLCREFDLAREQEIGWKEFQRLRKTLLAARARVRLSDETQASS